MGENSDVGSALVHCFGDIDDVHFGKDAESNSCGLVRWQLLEKPQRPVKFLEGIVAGSVGRDFFQLHRSGPLTIAPGGVDHPAVRSGEQPAPERSGISGEFRQLSSDLKPYDGGKVIRLCHLPGLEEAKQARIPVLPDSGDCALITVNGRFYQRIVKLLPRGRTTAIRRHASSSSSRRRI